MNIPYVEIASYDPTLSIVIFSVGMVSLIVGTFLLLFSKNNKTIIIGGSMVFLLIPSIIAAYFAYTKAVTVETNAHKDTLTQQTDQIKDTYGLGSLAVSNFTASMCSNLNADDPQRIPATWNSGYGTIVVGARQGGSCEVNVFEENGRKLEPVK